MSAQFSPHFFPPIREQMRRSPIYDLCLAIQFIPQEFANLQVTREEFLCMKAIILLNTGKTMLYDSTVDLFQPEQQRFPLNSTHGNHKAKLSLKSSGKIQLSLIRLFKSS